MVYSRIPIPLSKPNSASHVVWAMVVLTGIAVSLFGCLTPVDQSVNSGIYHVRVLVENTAAQPQIDVQTSIFSGSFLVPGAVPLVTAYSGKDGIAEFQVNIPKSGASFVIQAGDDNSGKLQFPVILQAKDTLIRVSLDLKSLECDISMADTLAVNDICAPLNDGREFSDSAQKSYRSGCTVPLVIHYAPVSDPFSVVMKILDGNGREITQNPFTLPPKESFLVRLIAHPKSAGMFTRLVNFKGNGDNGASIELNLLLRARSIECGSESCRDTTLMVRFPPTSTDTSDVVTLIRTDFGKNNTPNTRYDAIIKRFGSRSAFILLDSIKSVLPTGTGQSVRFRFSPRAEESFKDTMIIEQAFQGSSSRCRATIILSGDGCGPTCLVSMLRLQQGSSPNDFIMDLITVYPDESTYNPFVYFTNNGQCGQLKIRMDTSAFVLTNGYHFYSPYEMRIPAGEAKAYQFGFAALDNVVWPSGHGRPASVMHTQTMKIVDCGEDKRFTFNVAVDTMPIGYSRCIYQWSQNGSYGFLFEPVRGKGSEVPDPAPTASMLSDLVLIDVSPPDQAQFMVKSGWKLIRTAVQDADFAFSRIRSWPEYRSISTGDFQTDKMVTMQQRAVYSVRVNYDGIWRYALIRLREISIDGDGKRKVCLDILYPMIKER